MAKAIEFQVRPKSTDERLHESVSDSTPALEESLLLLRELHGHGVLDVLLKVVRGGEGLSAATLHLLGGNSGMNALRNVAEIGKTLTELDPREVQVLGHALSVGLSEGARHVAQGRGVGLPELLGLLRDRDVQLALGALFGILKGAGRAMREAREETTETANQAEVGR